MDDLHRMMESRTVLITKAICPGVPRMVTRWWRQVRVAGPALAPLPATIDIPWAQQRQWNAITTSPLPSWSHGVMESWSHTCGLLRWSGSSDLDSVLLNVIMSDHHKWVQRHLLVCPSGYDVWRVILCYVIPILCAAKVDLYQAPSGFAVLCPPLSAFVCRCCRPKNPSINICHFRIMVMLVMKEDL